MGVRSFMCGCEGHRCMKMGLNGYEGLWGGKGALKLI